MGKNWLIRTKSNHILGPVSKEKVQELYQNGSIKPDDEICSGNGYWFFIRESELVEKYLKGNAQQSFNPISEAKDILTASSLDLDDIEEASQDEVTQVGGIDLKKLQGEKSNPSISHSPKAEKPLELATEVPVKKKLKSETQVKNSGSPQKIKSQNWVRILGIAVFLVLFLMIYFRKTIMKSFFGQGASLPSVQSIIIAEATAQDETSTQKKNS